MGQTHKTPVKRLLNQAETPSLAQLAPNAPAVKTRSGPVMVLGLLLLLQAVGLFDLGLFFFTRGLGLRRSLIVEMLITEPINALAMGIIFIPLALLALLAALGFFRLWRAAWIMAMLTQGLSLLTALLLYFNQRPSYVYVIMLYSIFLVIYLHTAEVSTTFEPAATLIEEEDEA
ncbi:MAG: hypothetical protein L6R45_03565 [Anaerolineae bacterium]|nr:hypothetical protein [Anaerolineae bacterium]